METPGGGEKDAATPFDDESAFSSVALRSATEKAS